MPAAPTAVATTKGLRGVAQDFLAPELRALAERIQGFENLNKQRFEDVDRQFENVDRQFENVDRRFEDVNRRIDELKQDINRRFDEAKQDTDRQFADMNRRIDELKEDMNRRFTELKQDTDKRFESIENRLDAMAKDIAAIPHNIGLHIDRLIHEMNISSRLAVIERQNAGLSGLLEK